MIGRQQKGFCNKIDLSAMLKRPVEYRKVVFGKVDLDTCLTAVIMDVRKGDEIVCVRGRATETDLQDPKVLCIEVGGSGQTQLLNFDHHDTPFYIPPACVQAFNTRKIKMPVLNRLVKYVHLIDEAEPLPYKIPFPSLSNLFSGMLLVEKSAMKQFIVGIEILLTVIGKNIDPFQAMPQKKEWERYTEAKFLNEEKLKQSLKYARFYTTHQGRFAAFFQTTCIGGFSYFYEKGCEIIVLYNPSFGHPPVRKFTIATRSIDLIPLKTELCKLEIGWGGTRTIIGSPRCGTSLDVEVVIQAVINTL